MATSSRPLSSLTHLNGHMSQQRQQYRIPIDRSGHLTRRGKVSVCHISDVTEQGFQLQTDLPLVTGDVVRLTCALESQEEIECGVAVTHARPPLFGSRIVDISPDHQERLSRFIERLLTLTMMGLS
ncbi:MAG: hypothetical protein K0S58_3177 [Nitrospira sp.]|nr:hypothetical protein [Nitrospira sp.]